MIVVPCEKCHSDVLVIGHITQCPTCGRLLERRVPEPPLTLSNLLLALIVLLEVAASAWFFLNPNP